MSTAEIIATINALFETTDVPILSKRSSLQQLAREYWKAVFPEYGTAAYAGLSVSEKEKRWEIQRHKNELASYVNAPRLMKILESPATGDVLNWVK